MYSPGNAVDNNNDTYWATDDSVTTASLEINTGKVQTIKYVMLQEHIKLGQRVKSFTVDVWNSDAWQQVAAGTTIGYKRILKLAPVKAGRVRINITASKACPLISNVAIY
jgi:alpha-L-fucosidase